ncbi:hypothetical protein ACA910_011200 [Epithemia clementina (nom. ined.)]
MVLFTTSIRTPIHAACTATDRHGSPVVLHAPLFGVLYDARNDELTCQQQNSCREWNLRDCTVVKCLHSHACRNSHFTNVTTLSCFRYASCQEAQVIQAHGVTCGMDATNSCLQATMEIDTELTCWGQFACVSDADTQMNVTVGAHGVVRCLNGGARGYSCQHMVVWIDHARRACFGTGSGGELHGSKVNGEGEEKVPDDATWSSSDLPQRTTNLSSQHCAVLCDGEGECDKETILFRVLPSSNKDSSSSSSSKKNSLP